MSRDSLFGLYPELDLRISRYFYGIEDPAHNKFAFRFYPLLMRARDIGLWIGTALVAPAVAALAIKLIFPRRKLLMSRTDGGFPDRNHGSGARFDGERCCLRSIGAVHVRSTSSNSAATNILCAWWDPRGDCTSNCSFVSGDVTGAFWTVAPAALAPPHWRALAYGAALALGTAMAALRVMAGAHFPSDVIFAGVFTFLIVWIVYALIYRWPRTRLSDDGVERALERTTLPVYRFDRRITRSKAQIARLTD